MKPCIQESRRKFLTAAGWLLIMPAVGSRPLLNFADAQNPSPGGPQKMESPDEEVEVSATEDLMREHGVLRRTLVAYSEVAPQLRSNPSLINPDILQKAARLFQTFGEDYHERKLEEVYIFPVVKKMGGSISSLVDILLLQHARGREITQYILRMTEKEKLKANSQELSTALETFVRMYRSHAAREDTVLFPAWKKNLSASELEELAERFEDIEHQQFGEDGFDSAVDQITAIEDELGIGDLSKFTAPLPVAGKK